MGPRPHNRQVRYELPELGPGDFRFSCEIEVRFRDLDAMGHVNNAVYATYFEVARAGYMRAIGCRSEPDRSMAKQFPFVVLDLYCRYLSPAFMDERLVVYLRTTTVGTSSFVFDYLVTSKADARAVAQARTTQVYYDYATGQSMPLPRPMREAIARLESGPDPGDGRPA